MKSVEIREQVQSMAYRYPIIDRLDRQTQKGIWKYGDTLDKSGHLKNGMDRLEYLAEELTDGLVYIEHLKEYIHQLDDDRLFLLTICFQTKTTEEEWARITEIAKRAFKEKK